MELYQKNHDEVCVDIVGKISELGGFQVEFPVYVTCYTDKDDCVFFVSDDKMHVYNYIEGKLKEERYCLPPVRKTMSCIVSSGQKDELYQQFKVAAAREWMEEGAGEIARLLPKLAPKSTSEAQTLMELLRIRMKGVFNEELRALYKGLLDSAYYAKKITGAYYRSTMDWLAAEEQQLEDERVPHAVHERSYAGFGYRKPNGDIGYYTNAVMESTLTKREDMMVEGVMVSPVLVKRYCFNDISTIGNIVADFKAVLKQVINVNFMTLLQLVYEANNVADDLLEKTLAQTEPGSLQDKALRYYKMLWQL